MEGYCLSDGSKPVGCHVTGDLMERLRGQRTSLPEGHILNFERESGWKGGGRESEPDPHRFHPSVGYSTGNLKGTPNIRATGGDG